MNNKQIEQTIRAYLPQAIHMSVATAKDNKPWVFEVHYAFDDELNLYWFSKQSTRHSEEVAANPFVSGNIVTQHHLHQWVRGVSFEGTAVMVETLDEDSPAYKAYAVRFPDHAPGILQSYQKPEGGRIYKITVSDFYLIDGYTTGKVDKFHLSWSA